MKDFFDKFGSLKGASFIAIKNYENSYGEVSNVVVNTNVSVMNAKRKDLETLKSVTAKDLMQIAKEQNLDLNTLTIALAELLTSAQKNLSENLEDRTAQSQAQTDAYIHLSKSIKMHKETMCVYVTGFVNSKEVLVEGEYPNRKRQKKTICKNAIKKHCNLRMEKYRPYKLGRFDLINISGSTLQMK